MQICRLIARMINSEKHLQITDMHSGILTQINVRIISNVQRSCFSTNCGIASNQ
jgi:hypothetical protein